MSESEQQPVRTARKVALVAIGGILAVLGVMLVIVFFLGDTTNNLGENQPTQAPATSP